MRSSARGRGLALRFAFACLALLLVAGPAGAQSSSKAAAEALFDEGRRLVDGGHFAEACEKLAQSHALDPAAGTLLNLGDCYERAGRSASAWLAYTEAVTLAETSGRMEWATAARAKVRELRPGLPALRIVFPEPRPPGLEVLRDGTPLPPAEAGLAVPADPGRHTVEARAPGHVPFQAEVSLASGRTSEVRIPPLEKDRSSSVAASDAIEGGPDRATSRPRRAWGYVTAGVGLAAIAAGSVAGILAIGSKATARDHCSPDLLRCNDEGVNAMARARDQALVSTIGFAAGAVLLVTGGVLLLTAPRGKGVAASLDGSVAGSTRTGVHVSPFGARLVASW
jgi:hypothetical protein